MTTIRLKMDDLESIKGISSTRQQFLKEALDIQTFSQLADANPKSIRKCLKEKKHYVSLADISNWQTQAKKMASANAIVKSPPQNSKREKPNWHAFATYVVEFQERSTEEGQEFQTKVHHMEGGYNGGGRGDKWEGVAVKEAGLWIENDAIELVSAQKGAGVAVEAKSDDDPAPSTKTVKTNLTAVSTNLKISHVEIFQPSNAVKPIGTGLDDHMFNGYLTSDQPFTLATEITITATTDDSPTIYLINCYVTNRQTGEVIKFKQTKDQISGKGKLKKITRLPEVTLPPGLYRLQAWVTLHTKPAILDFLEIPLLQVA